ncbi:methyltransferase [Bradyrhizobium elkanii]|uniref:methyltransferase n=1 Tax=Bradyrhizobium elkanii TaxID=29448 RepID=UPI0004B14A01|nr:methyltransferase [Bradyrhizobium elkanii]
MTQTPKRFSFQDHASMFDSHISASIPGYEDLLSRSVILSRRFVQPGTNVVDVGCSTGLLLARVRRQNQTVHRDVTYTGIDCEPGFSSHWIRREAENLHFQVRDASKYQFENVSLASSLFTVQFLRPADKRQVLRRIHDGLVEEGALIIAEKTLAENARLQDALTFPYYDYKLGKGFTPEQILDKERSLRGQMTLWTEAELSAALADSGFRQMQTFWKNMIFVAVLAIK